MYSCHLFLISSASVRSISFLSFIKVSIFAWNGPLVSLGKISSLFCSIVFLYFLHCLLGKAFFFLNLFLLFFGTLHSNGYIFPFFLCLSRLFFFHLYVRPPQTSILPFLHFFFLGMVLITASYTMSRTSIHSSSVTLSDLIPWIYLSLPLYNRKGFDLGHTWKWSSGFPYFLQLKSDLAIRSSWSEPQSAPGLVFADCIELLHFWLKKNIISLISVLTIGDVHV